MKWNKKTAAAVLAGVLFVSFVPFFARSRQRRAVTADEKEGG